MDLAGPFLQLLALGETNPHTFPWLDPPAESALASAWEILTTLGFLTDNRLSPDGAMAARFPIHPRLSRLLISGHQLGIPERATLAAAILSDAAFDEDEIVKSTKVSEHENKGNLDLIVIRGRGLMSLVHALYERAANEA